MKRKIILTIMCICLILTAGIVLFSTLKREDSREDNIGVSLYSKHNAPIFHGTTSITIDKDVTSNFDLKDSRFRTYARDFEDGDLTSKIVVLSNNVNPAKAGNYKIKYSVTDSHKNKTTITVPVTVTDQTSGKCVIQRTLYTTPSIEHLSSVKVLRFHNGDKQNLGVFVPSNEDIDIKVVSADKNIQLTFWGNDSAKESHHTLNCAQNEYCSFKNIKNGVSYDSVIFAQSVIQDKGADVNKTYTIELAYDKNLPALDLYYDGDDDQQFIEGWTESQNAFALVESANIAVIVPLEDIDKLPDGTQNGDRFVTLQSFIDFYNETVMRMGAMIGLSKNPTRATDQEVPSKVFLKADFAQKAGLAFYANGSDYVGLSNRTSVSAYFYYGWGTLHEIGHGSQGYFGRGIGGNDTMMMGEVGNNILAYYIQKDKSLYTANHNWLGNLSSIEERINAIRLSKTENYYGLEVANKLYFFINLFDSFEGADTYAKMFSYYRDLYITQNKTDYAICEIYVKFVADEYNVNILPYFDAWGLNVGDNVKREIMQRDLTPYYITADVVGEENLATLMASEDITLKYGLTSKEVFDKHDIKGNLSLTLNIDNFSKLSGKQISLYNAGEKVGQTTIMSNTINFSDLDLGTYEVRLPIDFDYNNDYLVVHIGEGDNVVEYSYDTDCLCDYTYTPTILRIVGIHYTKGCEIAFSEYNKTATVSYGGADLGNRLGDWTTTRLDETYIKITIADNAGGIVFEREVKGNEYFSTSAQTLAPFAVEYGYTVTVYTQKPNLVFVRSATTQNDLNEYNCSDNTLVYEVTQYGLKLLNVDNFDEQTIVYNDTKNYLIDKITAYKNGVSAREIQNRRINPKQKIDVICAYNALHSEDRAEFDEFVTSIKQGGVPIVTILKNSIKVVEGEKLDIVSVVSAYDNEDGALELTTQNTHLSEDVERLGVGTHKVVLSVYDDDGNCTMTELAVTVEKTNTTLPLWIIIVVLLATFATATIFVVVKLKREK